MFRENIREFVKDGLHRSHIHIIRGCLMLKTCLGERIYQGHQGTQLKHLQIHFDLFLSGQLIVTAPLRYEYNRGR